MTVVDGLVFGVLTIGLILGLMKGFLAQVAGIAGFVGGWLLAWRFHPVVEAQVIDRMLSTAYNDKIAFASILLGVLAVTALISWLVNLFLEKLNLSAYDRLIGGAFGAAKAGIVAAALLIGIVVMAQDGGDVERAIGSSKAGPFIWQTMDSATKWLPEGVRGDVRGFLTLNSLPEPVEARSTPGQLTVE
ncbi:MAG: CvpA family protein [Planctomycetota bacterium]|jgi:membrane protein required for colicin V production